MVSITLRTKTDLSMFFSDNYDSQLNAPTEIHLRWGNGFTKVIDFYQASNGFVYVTAASIPDLVTPNAVLSSAATEFAAFLNAKGLTETVNNLKDVTMFVLYS